MGKPRLPDLPDTGRRYLDGTARARLASPGLERYRVGGGVQGARIAVAAVVLAALLAAMIWLAG